MSDREIESKLYRADRLLRQGGQFLGLGRRQDAARCADEAQELLLATAAGRLAQALRQFPKRSAAAARRRETILVPRDPGVLNAA